MKKIVKLYEDNKIIFLVIVLFWIEIITEICTSFLIYLWNHSWSGFGDPHNKRITNAGDTVANISIIIFVLLVVIPVIIMVISLIKHLTFKRNVIPFLAIVIFAFEIGWSFANIYDVGISKLIYSFSDYLNDKYTLIEDVGIWF